MDARLLVLLALQVSIICTVAGFGLRATASDLWLQLKRPQLLLRSLLAMLVIMPALAIALSMAFEFRRPVEIALIALAISPVPPLLPQREARAGGRQSYALTLLAVLALVSIVTVPLWAEILERVSGRPLGVPPATVARVVLTMIIAPLLGGVAVRAWLPGLAARIERPLAVIARVLLPVAIVALLVGAWRSVLAAVGDYTILAMVAFVAAGLAVGHLLGGPLLRTRAVLALSTACRHPAIALSIASANFPEEHFGGTILLYLLVNTIVAVPYLAWVRRQHRSPE